MSRLLVKPQGERGKVISVTPESAGWRYVGFELHRLGAGEVASGETGESVARHEVCAVGTRGLRTFRAAD